MHCLDLQSVVRDQKSWCVMQIVILVSSFSFGKFLIALKDKSVNAGYPKKRVADSRSEGVWKRRSTKVTAAQLRPDHVLLRLLRFSNI